MADDRSYTPPEISLARYRDMALALGLSRVVIVQPSIYGVDNGCLGAALQECGSDARGIIGIDDSTTDGMLDHFNRIGVRGVRINAISNGRTDPGALAARLGGTASRIQSLGWHIQIYSDLSQIEAAAAAIETCPVPVVIDHFGLARGPLGVMQPGFKTLLRLVRQGDVWVKLSGADRLSADRSSYSDMAPLVQALSAANLDHLIWGSDWPHTPLHSQGRHKDTGAAAFRDVDDGGLLAALATWIGDDLYRVLVANPARLYGFAEVDAAQQQDEPLRRAPL